MTKPKSLAAFVVQSLFTTLIVGDLLELGVLACECRIEGLGQCQGGFSNCTLVGLRIQQLQPYLGLGGVLLDDISEVGELTRSKHGLQCGKPKQN